jgi:hypothetical protein
MLQSLRENIVVRINMAYKKIHVNSPHSHKCYINMLMNLNNCKQHV